MNQPNSNEPEKLIDPEKYQVFLFSCPAPVPVHFASHPWFVVNKKGACSRWEVLQSKRLPGEHWGYLYKNALPLFQETVRFLHTNIFWNGKRKFLGMIEGGEGSDAHRMAEFLERSPSTYPLSGRYTLPGPNSNTFAAWVLTHFPAFPATLAKNAFGKNYRMAKVQTGVVHGRFQPPHNGHMRYILAALERCEHLTIGICTPKLCSEEESRATGYPCTAKLNPFSHDERCDMISLALSDAGVSSDRYSFVAFPSDYKNLDAILPKDAVFFMSVTAGSDSGKIAYIEGLGYTTQTIMEIPETASRERSGAVRDGAALGTSDWHDAVPPAVRKYITEKGLLPKLASGSSVLE